MSHFAQSMINIAIARHIMCLVCIVRLDRIPNFGSPVHCVHPFHRSSCTGSLGHRFRLCHVALSKKRMPSFGVYHDYQPVAFTEPVDIVLGNRDSSSAPLCINVARGIWRLGGSPISYLIHKLLAIYCSGTHVYSY